MQNSLSEVCMNVVSGVIAMPLANKAIKISQRTVDSFELNLTDDTWMIGIDQSTTNSGIALMSSNSQFVILLDLHRDKNLEKKIFYKDFFNLLRKLVTGKRIRILAYEKPVPSRNKRYARSVLTELKGHLDEWIEMIPELSEAYVKSMYPQSWKPYVLNPAKGKGRSNDKTATAEDLVDMFPVLKEFYEFYPYKDYDSFDALGVLIGVLNAAFDKNGSPRIFGDVEKTHVSFVCYSYVDKEDLSNPDFLRDLFGIAYVQYKPRFLSYNINYNLYRNIRMASTSGQNIYTIVPKAELGSFQWKYGVDPEDDNKVFLMFVFKRGNLNKREYDTLKSIFKWHEDIYGEV